MSERIDIPIRSILWSFIKMGAVLIGGGYALLPLLEREVVLRRKWAKSEDMIDLYALAQLLPGVIAVNTAMLIGNRLRGLAGTIAAAVGLTLVPFALIAVYAAAYGTLRDTALFARVLSGIQPAVAGMILGLGLDMIRKVVGCPRSLAPRASFIIQHSSFILAIVSVLVVLLFNPSFGWLILFSLVVGLAIHFVSIRRRVLNG